MKKMTCNQLGGACNLEFQAETFQEMKEMSMAHGKEMFAKGDESHLAAMNVMREKMTNPGAMEKWMNDKEKEFNALPSL